MNEIEKLKGGRALSRQQHSSAKEKFEEAYANASLELRDQIDGLLASSQSYSSANPMNNRSTREYETRMYENMTDILNETYSKPSSLTMSTPNIFNGYSHIENQNNADYVTNRYMSHARGRRGSSSGRSSNSSSGTSTSSRKYFKFNWAKGLNEGFNLESDTLESRSKKFVEILQRNIKEALDSNKEIVGIEKQRLIEALTLLQNLNYNNFETYFPAIMKATELLNGNPDVFRSYFGKLFPGEDPISKRKKALKEEGYEFVDGGNYGAEMNDIILKGGYHVAKKDGKLYLLSDNYSGPATGAAKAYIGTDYRDQEGYGKGYVIGDDGSFVYGDMNQYYYDLLSPWYKSLNTYLTELGNDQRWKISGAEFDEFGSISKNNLLNTMAHTLHGKKIIDVSSYFGGKDVVATIDGNNIEPYVDKYGHLKLDQGNFTFHYLDDNGNKHSVKYSDAIKNLGDLDLAFKLKNRGLDEFVSTDYNLDELVTEAIDQAKDVNQESGFYNFFSKNREMKNKWEHNEITDSDHDLNSSYGHHNNNAKFARLMLYAFSNQNELSRSNDKAEAHLYRTLMKYLDDPVLKKKLIKIIWDQMRNNSEQFEGKNYDKYRQAFLLLLVGSKSILSENTKSLDEIQLKKQGGILKAAYGTAIDIAGNQVGHDDYESIAARIRDKSNKLNLNYNALADRAEENGRSREQQRAIEANKWTSSDTLRATALVTDIAGLVAAISGAATGGVGNLVAMGTGLASTVQDAIADFTDDKVSTGQAWKNVGLNVVLSGAQAVGGKAPKMIRTVIKLLPKALMYIGGVGLALDPEIQKSVGKALSGKSLNLNDWKNIMWVFKYTTSIGTVHTMQRGAKKGQNKFDEKLNKNLNDISANSQLDPNVRIIKAEGITDGVKIHKDRINAVNKLLKEGKLDEAKTLLMTDDPNLPGVKVDEAGANSILNSLSNTKSGVKKLKFWDKNAGELTEFGSERARQKSYGDDIMAEARLKTIEQIRQEAQNSHKLKLFNKWEKGKLAEANNAQLNAALLESANSGRAYKSIRDLVKGENELLGGITPSQAAKLLGIEQADLEVRLKDYNESELRVKAAEEKLAAAEEALNSARTDDGEVLSVRRDAALRELDVANTERQKLLDILTDIGNLIRAMEVRFRDPAIVKRNKGLKGRSIMLANIEAEANMKSAVESVMTAENKIKVMSEDPFYSRAFRRNSHGDLMLDANGIPLLRKNAGKILLGQIQPELDALKNARNNLAALKKKNRIYEVDAWNEYNKLLKQGETEQTKLDAQDLDITNRLDAIAKLREKIKSFEDNIKIEKDALDLRNLELNNLKYGHRIGVLENDVTIRVKGVDVEIPKGADIKSYKHLGEGAAKFIESDSRMKMLDLNDPSISKLFPSNMRKQLKGAAIDTINRNIAIWEKGGKIEDYTDRRTSQEKKRGVGTPLEIKNFLNQLISVGYSKAQAQSMLEQYNSDQIKRIIMRKRKK